MIEQMKTQMATAAADDEAVLRRRILETQKILRTLQDQYIERYGAPPTPIRLDSPESAEFCAGVEDAQDALGGTYDQRGDAIEAAISCDDRAARHDFENQPDPFETT